VRFAIISLSIYFLLQTMGIALADISDLKFPEFKMRAEPEMHFEYLPGFLHSDELKRNDPSNVFSCDGYLTNNPAENFCSKTVPADWTSHEFNGEVFYLVPLNHTSSRHP
jgi:hypothetical protein